MQPKLSVSSGELWVEHHASLSYEIHPKRRMLICLGLPRPFAVATERRLAPPSAVSL
jgi:hypothetical protein